MAGTSSEHDMIPHTVWIDLRPLAEREGVRPLLSPSELALPAKTRIKLFLARFPNSPTRDIAAGVNLSRNRCVHLLKELVEFQEITITYNGARQHNPPTYRINK